MARRAASAPYVTRNAAPTQRTTSTSQGSRSNTIPAPAMPSAISTRSESAQIATTASTCSRRRPCRSTNAFWAPIAMMSDRPRKKPETALAVQTAEVTIRN